MHPIRLYKNNPRYLEFRGKPVVLVSSAEHYGSAINPDFDFLKHLDALAAHGLNHARVFMGTYAEVPGAFGIEDNTLAPASGRMLAPWARTQEPGCVPGGAKFDLHVWDGEYFERLKAICAAADTRDIVLEIVLFSYIYSDDLWRANPMNAGNNVNGVGAIGRAKVFTLDNGELLGVQERVVKRIVESLSDFDNIYYEIINEPYCDGDGGDFAPWQDHIAGIIRDSEPDPRRHHLIARNVSNCTRLLQSVHPLTGIVNFHYAIPEAVYANYHHERVVGFDETGFSGQSMEPYRVQAWSFMLAGGGVFSHLDYSFTTSHPDGTASITGSTPGFGGVYWRKQLRVLKQFLESVECWTMSPANHLQPAHERTYVARVLADERRGAYAAYLDRRPGSGELVLFMRPGTYRAEWVSPTDGASVTVEVFGHGGGPRRFVPPPFERDMALSVRRAHCGESPE